MKRRVYLLSLMVWLTVSAIGSGQTAGPGGPPPGVDKPPAPAFSVTSLRGEKFELAALRGKVVVLNFWFIGCAPCVAEFAQLNRLVKEFGGKGVVFIAPAMDDVATLKPFLKKHRFEYQVVPDAGVLIFNTYSDGSGKVAFPTHIVIDQEGRIDMRVIGAEQVGDLRKAIARLVNERQRQQGYMLLEDKALYVSNLFSNMWFENGGKVGAGSDTRLIDKLELLGTRGAGHRVVRAQRCALHDQLPGG